MDPGDRAGGGGRQTCSMRKPRRCCKKSTRLLTGPQFEVQGFVGSCPQVSAVPGLRNSVRQAVDRGAPPAHASLSPHQMGPRNRHRVALAVVVLTTFGFESPPDIDAGPLLDHRGHPRSMVLDAPRHRRLVRGAKQGQPLPWHTYRRDALASTYAGVREGIIEYSKTFTIDRQRHHRGRIHDHCLTAPPIATWRRRFTSRKESAITVEAGWMRPDLPSRNSRLLLIDLRRCG